MNKPLGWGCLGVSLSRMFDWKYHPLSLSLFEPAFVFIAELGTLIECTTWLSKINGE